ncbi:MAG: methylated-DNA--[protein]-cysteine S-methyltransferase [Bacteroidota bacterium]
MATLYTDFIESPAGWISIQGTDAGLTEIGFIRELHPSTDPYPNDITNLAKQQLGEYIQGTRNQFSLPISPTGTPFELQVWEQVQHIAYGSTITYKQIAEALGNRLASQAVGNANGKNKLLIVIPCHRVIGSQGELTGYAGGISRKEWLLRHEGALLL